MRNVLFFLMIVSSALVFAGGREPIREGEVSYDTHLNMDKVTGVVKKAFIQRGWRIRENESSYILARLEQRGFTVDVKATWTNGLIHLTYVDSTKLDYAEKKGQKLIHRNYNKWITYLERDITVFLSDFVSDKGN